VYNNVIVHHTKRDDRAASKPCCEMHIEEENDGIQFLHEIKEEDI
jgi:hypothetical protein